MGVWCGKEVFVGRAGRKGKLKKECMCVKEVGCPACGGTGQDKPPPGKYHGICSECAGTGKKKRGRKCRKCGHR